MTDTRNSSIKNHSRLKPRCQTGSVLLLLFSAMLLWSGCEEDVVAVSGTDYVFTFYGAFNPAADTQKVRVFPIMDRLAPTGSEPIDAVVTSTDLTTGEVQTWQDSLLHFSDGTSGHLYWSLLKPSYGHSYRVEISRSDGKKSEATVEVPAQVEPSFLDPIIALPDVRIPIFMEGDAPRLVKTELDYWVRYDSTLGGATHVTIPYYDIPQKVEGGWVIDVDLNDDYQEITRILCSKGLLQLGYGVGLQEVNVRTLVVDEAWNPPGGEFDAEVMVQPGTMSNVENGFGFLGAGYPVTLRWRPNHEVMRAAGFRFV